MMEIRDFIGVGIAGILSVLWFDIRGIRKERDEHKQKINDRLKNYLKEEKHTLLCENAALKLEKKLDETKDEIIKEIRNNYK